MDHSPTPHYMVSFTLNSASSYIAKLASADLIHA